MANTIRDQISCEVRDAKLFALMGGESTQVSVVLSRLDALRETQPHCLCCSVLWWHVCPGKTQRRGPQALYIQWHTHHQSLVLVDCVRKAKPAGEFCFVVVQDMHTFFSSLFVNALVTEKQSELEQSQQSIRLEKHSDTWSPCHKTLCKQCKKTLSAIIADLMDILLQPKFTQIRCWVHASPDQVQGWHSTILWSLAGHFHWPRTLMLVVTRIKEKHMGLGEPCGTRRRPCVQRAVHAVQEPQQQPL